MIDINKQIDNWHQGAVEDLDVAKSLIKKKKYKHGLFFTHLALEKLLKAHICKNTKDLAPKIHNLVRLAEIASLTLCQKHIDILAELNIFNIEGRYPDSNVSLISKPEAKNYLRRAEEVFKWLIAQL